MDSRFKISDYFLFELRKFITKKIQDKKHQRETKFSILHQKVFQHQATMNYLSALFLSPAIHFLSKIFFSRHQF